MQYKPEGQLFKRNRIKGEKINNFAKNSVNNFQRSLFLSVFSPIIVVVFLYLIWLTSSTWIKSLVANTQAQKLIGVPPPMESAKVNKNHNSLKHVQYKINSI